MHIVLGLLAVQFGPTIFEQASRLIQAVTACRISRFQEPTHEQVLRLVQQGVDRRFVGEVDFVFG